MATIWDVPHESAFALDEGEPQLTGDTPMLPANTRGDTTHGPLITPAGRGVYNGIPYGEQLQTEQFELTEQFKFFPAEYAALRAQTNKALGR